MALNTLPELFGNAAKVAGDVQIYFKGEAITFFELELETRKVALGLSKLGVGPGDRVGFWLPNLKAYLGLLGACGQLGAIAVAMNTRFRRTEIEDVLRRVQPKVVAFVTELGRSSHSEILDAIEPGLLSGVKALIQCDKQELYNNINAETIHYESLTSHGVLENPLCDAESGCVIFNTSGTTSLPKFVLHNQKRVVEHAGDVAHILEMSNPNTVVLQSLPFCGVFGFIFLAAAIRAAAVCVMPVIFEATESAQLMIDYKVTHAAGGDDMFSRLLEAGIRITGDAPIPFPDLQFCPYASFNSALADFPETAFKRGIPLVAPFGMSEVFSFFSLRKMTDDQNIRTIGGGFPVNGKSKVRVRDPDTRKLLGFEQEGELEMWSPNIFVEYYGNNGAYTATFTEDGFLKTGDLGTVSKNGSFTYLGRMGDVLRLGGFLVNPLEIEIQLCSHQMVEDAQVVAVATDRGNKAVAFIIPQEMVEINEAVLIEYCKQTLAGFKVPIKIISIDTFPSTPSPNGTKIQKGALRDLAMASI